MIDEIPVSRSFQQLLISCNNLDALGFKEWVFHPAMLFGSMDKWWGDQGKRDRPHEGLDLCAYRTEKGNINYLDEKTGVPVIFKGQVVKVTEDFLGESLFVSHDVHNKDGRQLYTIDGHIRPGDLIHPGAILNEGDIIGTITTAKKNGGGIRPHLHITMAWISNTVSPQELGWEIVGDFSRVALIDPFRVIECPYSIEADV